MPTDKYGTVANFDAYFAERETLETYSDDAKNKALLVASEWLDNKYRSSFGGLKTGGRDQEREWPRNGHFDVYGYNIPSTETPREIERATYEAAKVELVTPGTLSRDFTPSAYDMAAVDGAVNVKFKAMSNVSDFQIMVAKVAEHLSALIAQNGSSSLTGSSSR